MGALRQNVLVISAILFENRKKWSEILAFGQILWRINFLKSTNRIPN